MFEHSRSIYSWHMVQKNHAGIGSYRRSDTRDGQAGERRPHPHCHRRRTQRISWQLVDPFEFCGFRHDADKASTWLQGSAVDLASPQGSGGQSVLWKLVAKFLLVVAMANFLVASLLWDITTTMDLTLIERRKLRQSVIGPIIRGMILTKNLVQNLQWSFR